MRLIEQSVEIWDQTIPEFTSDVVVGSKIHRELLLEDILKQIERVGRVCYKSEDKIAPGSAVKFVNMLKEHAHGAMLEHGTIYLDVFVSKSADMGTAEDWWDIFRKYEANPYSKVVRYDDDEYFHLYITTNYRVIVENNWESDLEYLCERTTNHKQRVCAKFITDQGVMREFTRHRSHSFACESTRYCNYSKSKFGNNITYIIPNWLNLKEGLYTYEYPDEFTKDGRKFEGNTEFNSFLIALARSEDTYLRLIEQGWKPQHARNVLPLATKCELVMTGFVEDWEHFFSLRTSVLAGNSPHPQAAELADNLYYQFKERKLI